MVIDKRDVFCPLFDGRKQGLDDSAVICIEDQSQIDAVGQSLIIEVNLNVLLGLKKTVLARRLIHIDNVYVLAPLFKGKAHGEFGAETVAIALLVRGQ